MKTTVHVSYTYDIEYEHQDHLEYLKAELCKAPIFSSFRGCGNASDNKIYSYECKRTGNGIIKE